MKKLTLAQAKKACQCSPSDMKGWCYMDIVRTVENNAKACLEQEIISKSVYDKFMDYAITQADKGSY